MVGDGKWLSIAGVIDRLRAAGYDDSEQTVRRLIDAGKLESYRTERGGHRRISVASVDELIEDRRRGEDDSGSGTTGSA